MKTMSTQYDEDHRLYQQGREAMEKGDLEKAIQSLKESALLLPHFKTYESIGECLLNQNNYGEAVIYLSAAAGLRSNQSRPLYLLAKALVELKDFEEAKEKLNRVLSINPDYKAAKDLLSEIS